MSNEYEWIDGVCFDKSGKVVFVSGGCGSATYNEEEHDRNIQNKIKNAQRKRLARGGYGGNNGDFAADGTIHIHSSEKSEMTAVEYLKIRSEMTASCNIGCRKCPLDWENNGFGIGCCSFENSYPEKAVSIVQKWAEDQAHGEAAESSSQAALNEQPDPILNKGVLALFGYFLGDEERLKSPLMGEYADIGVLAGAYLFAKAAEKRLDYEQLRKRFEEIKPIAEEIEKYMRKNEQAALGGVKDEDTGL